MKNALIFISFIFCQVIYSQSFFKLTNEVDEFGDIIGEVLMNVSYGNFSNTATTNSILKVHTIYEKYEKFTDLKEFKKYYTKRLQNLGYSEKFAKSIIGDGRIMMKEQNKALGELRFKLFEYGDKEAVTFQDWGKISIKTSDGKKYKASIPPGNIRNGLVTILGYKPNSRFMLEETKELSSIYNEILNEKNKVEIVIQIRRSSYNFVLNSN